MILYIGKVAAKQKDCPVNEMLFGKLIQYMFDDQERASKIPRHFSRNVSKINSIFMKEKGISAEEALKRRDRDIFKHINLFPRWMYEKFSTEIQWYSAFLQDGIADNHIKYVWDYLDAIFRKLEPVSSDDE